MDDLLIVFIRIFQIDSEITLLCYSSIITFSGCNIRSIIYVHYLSNNVEVCDDSVEPDTSNENPVPHLTCGTNVSPTPEKL